jgi:FkbM family methyltransferase
MSTTFRMGWLKCLSSLGIKKFVGTSGLGYRYVCHIGEFLGENPFYNREVFRAELILCAAWLANIKKPVVYDVGANVGFFCTHLAQMLGAQSPKVYAFEPVPDTFCKLLQSVTALGLKNYIDPIAVAITDNAGALQLSYSTRYSLFAQVTPGGLNLRVGDRLVFAAGFSLDAFWSLTGVLPSLVKIDVEGGEVAVLRGAEGLLSQPNRPALLFEFNPITLAETKSSRGSFDKLLVGYTVYYVDDFEGQKISFGDRVERIDDIHWVCNLFAVPTDKLSCERWESTLNDVRISLRLRIK